MKTSQIFKLAKHLQAELLQISEKHGEEPFVEIQNRIDDANKTMIELQSALDRLDKRIGALSHSLQDISRVGKELIE